MRKVRVILPDGFVVTADLAISEYEKRRGLVAVPQLPPYLGILFVHAVPGFYPFWMQGCLIPLDIIWIDASKRVVEITPNCPPRIEAQSRTYGGNQAAQYVLEIGAGEAARHGVTLGSEIRF